MPITLPAITLNGIPPPMRRVLLPPTELSGAPQVDTGDAPPVAVDPEAQRRALMSVQPQGSTDPMQDPAFRAYVAKQAQDVAELRAAQAQAAETRGSVGMRVGNALLTFGGAGPEALAQRYAQAGQPVTDVLERQKVARGATEDVGAEQKLQGDIRQNALATQANDPGSQLSRARAMLALHQGLITRDQLQSYTAAMDDALHKGVESQSRLITARAAESQAAQSWDRVVDEQTGETYLVNKRTGARLPLAGGGASLGPPSGAGPAANGGAAGGPPPAGGPGDLRAHPIDTSTPMREPGGTGLGDLTAPENATAPTPPATRAASVEAYRRGKMPAEVRKQLDDAEEAIVALNTGMKATQDYPGAFGAGQQLSEYLPNIKAFGTDIMAPLTAAFDTPARLARSKEEEGARAAVFSQAYSTIHKLAGAQLSQGEAARLRAFLPNPNDTVPEIQAKLQQALSTTQQQYLRTRATYLPGMPAPGAQGQVQAPPQTPQTAGKSKLEQTLRTNPAALGPYAPILLRAARQGQQSFDANVYALSQTDPAFNDLSRKLSEAKQ